MSSPDSTLDDLAHRVTSGDRPALARALSLVEDAIPGSEKLLDTLFPRTGKAKVIGVTGSPGAGKSTLVDQLVNRLAGEQKARVAVLAVDPTSPFTGGALLGDRIRMTKAVDHQNVFIRSMASRGALGGIAPRTAELIFVFDAAGYDYVIVETVGVGQAEVEIVRMADTVLVALVPGMGDGVQALKAGILEIADVFVINKADYDGASRLEKELIALLSLQEKRDWKPPIKRTVATTGTGIPELLEAVGKHQKWGRESGALEKRRQTFLEETLLREVTETVVAELRRLLASDKDAQRILGEVRARRRAPSLAAAELSAKRRK